MTSRPALALRLQGLGYPARHAAQLAEHLPGLSEKVVQLADADPAAQQPAQPARGYFDIAKAPPWAPVVVKRGLRVTPDQFNPRFVSYFGKLWTGVDKPDGTPGYYVPPGGSVVSFLLPRAAVDVKEGTGRTPWENADVTVPQYGVFPDLTPLVHQVEAVSLEGERTTVPLEDWLEQTRDLGPAGYQP